MQVIIEGKILALANINNNIDISVILTDVSYLADYRGYNIIDKDIYSLSIDDVVDTSKFLVADVFKNKFVKGVGVITKLIQVIDFDIDITD